MRSTGLAYWLVLLAQCLGVEPKIEVIVDPASRLGITLDSEPIAWRFAMVSAELSC
jgi:hypothetical protein